MMFIYKKVYLFQYWGLCLVSGILLSCNSSKVETNRLPFSHHKINLGKKESLSIPIQKKDPLLFMPQNKGSLTSTLFLGKLTLPSHLQTNSGKITLTQISMQAAISIETGYFQLGAKQYDKFALIIGDWDGGEMIYQAEIVCILDQVLDQKLKRNLEEGKIKLADICR